MVRFTRHIADAATWLKNLASSPQRRNLSENVINVLGRTMQRIHGRFYGITSKNIDFSVSFENEALREWLFRYYKLQSITITNNATNIWNTDFYGVKDSPAIDFQRCNIIGVKDYEPNLLPFNMYGVNDTVDANVFSVDFVIQGRLSEKQKADIKHFINLRTQKRVNYAFVNPIGDEVIVQVYFKSNPLQLVDIDLIVDESNNVFVNGILETDPAVSDIYNIVKITAMEKITFTGNGSQKIFTSGHSLNSTDIVAQARLQSSGQVVEADITITTTTIAIDTGAVAVANGTKIDILLTKN